MRMKDMPWFNRPSTKLLRKGPSFLDDGELLALIFQRGNSTHNALELSHLLLAQHNLHHLNSCSSAQLQDVLNDETKVQQIKALAELCKRYSSLQRKAFRSSIDSANDVFEHFREQLNNKSKEHLYALLLDSKNKILKEELISIGTLNQSFAHPREVFHSAIREAANSIILVHNHPSGDPSPSKDDLEVTKKLEKAGKLLGISFLDHIIIGDTTYWSWMESK